MRRGYAGQGGMGGWEFIPILTQNVGLLCGRNRLWGEGGGGGGGEDRGGLTHENIKYKLKHQLSQLFKIT